MRLGQQIRIAIHTDASAVRHAAADLRHDLMRVLGAKVVAAATDGPADIVVRLEPGTGPAESWRIEIGERVMITGADELGAVYGIYTFCRQFLGVDPLWYWKDLEPVPLERLDLEPRTLHSPQPAFRWRGWFINDEDLMTEWMDGSGPRYIRYPFYFQVIHPAIADRIFEACLRSGCNLIIPASFLDVMNAPEAALIRHAVERGLFVTQHHIEPLGVSHFSFENYWRQRGGPVAFSYASEPERVRQVWRDYAWKYRELAGDHVVWQLGLRGKGDLAIWVSDPSVSREVAGRFISQAMREQMEIVREVDPRPHPPVTTTLWREGSDLMRSGSLVFPEGIIIVFADEGASQLLLADFHESERQETFEYGLYYHVAFWREGPHLVQGAVPAKLAGEYAHVLARGDTAYSIVNVSNIREHALGAQACSEVMLQGTAFDMGAFLDRWAHGNAAIRELTLAFIAAFPVLAGGERPDQARVVHFQDGYAVLPSEQLLAWFESDGKSPYEGLHGATAEQLLDSARRFEEIVARFDALEIPERERVFRTHHLRTQAVIMVGALRFTANLARARQDRAHLAAAVTALRTMLAERERFQTGRWRHWYRGDKKENWPALLVRAERLVIRFSGEIEEKCLENNAGRSL